MRNVLMRWWVLLSGWFHSVTMRMVLVRHLVCHFRALSSLGISKHLWTYSQHIRIMTWRKCVETNEGAIWARVKFATTQEDNTLNTLVFLQQLWIAVVGTLQDTGAWAKESASCVISASVLASAMEKRQWRNDSPALHMCLSFCIMFHNMFHHCSKISSIIVLSFSRPPTDPERTRPPHQYRCWEPQHATSQAPCPGKHRSAPGPVTRRFSHEVLAWKWRIKHQELPYHVDIVYVYIYIYDFFMCIYI